MDYDSKIKALLPSKADLAVMLKEMISVDINLLSESEVARYAHITAAMSLCVSCLKDNVKMNVDRFDLIYGKEKPTIAMYAYVRSLCRMSEPLIGELSSQRIEKELGSSRR